MSTCYMPSQPVRNCLKYEVIRYLPFEYYIFSDKSAHRVLYTKTNINRLAITLVYDIVIYYTCTHIMQI